LADSFNKKEREKKKRKKRQEKLERKKQRKEEGGIKTEEFMYVDSFGNLTTTPPELQVRDEVKLEEINISTPKKTEVEEDPRKTGFVKYYNYEKHFGFIKEALTGHEHFVHADSVNGDLSENMKVEYEIGQGHKGPMAVKVEIIRD